MEDLLYKFLSVYNRLPLPLRQLIGRIYRAVPARLKYGTFYFKYLGRIERFQRLKERNAMKKAIDNLLTEQVNAAIDAIPFYKSYKKLDSAKDIRKYPVISKQTVIDHFHEFLNPDTAGKRIRANTGGSSGTPMEFYIEKHVSRPKEKAHFDWYWGQFGYRPGNKMLMVRGMPLTGGRQWEYRTIDNILNVSCYNINEQNILPVLKEINAFEPAFIHAYPSSLKLIVSLLEPYKEQLHVRPHAVFLGSEYLPDTDRTLFESFFQAQAVNWYGHSERLIHGGNCPFSGEYHFYPTYGYLELLDDRDQVISEPGQEGRIVATGFDNLVMPFIRYDTGDRGTLSSTSECRCGFRGQSLKSISGRGQDMIVLSDGTRVSLTAFIFGQHPEAFQKIREMQVIQHDRGHIELSIVRNNDYTARDEKDLVDTLHRSVNGKVKISVSYTSSVPKTQRGKNIFFVSKINN